MHLLIVVVTLSFNLEKKIVLLKQYSSYIVHRVFSFVQSVFTLAHYSPRVHQYKRSTQITLVHFYKVLIKSRSAFTLRIRAAFVFRAQFTNMAGTKTAVPACVARALPAETGRQGSPWRLKSAPRERTRLRRSVRFWLMSP